MENFDIEDEARGFQKPVVRYFNASVTDNTLEIRFYWAGKGTTRIPNRGDYGSLISAISVDPSMFPIPLFPKSSTPEHDCNSMKFQFFRLSVSLCSF